MYSVSANPGYEDFTTFDENDANNRYSKSAYRLNITDLDRVDDNHYVSKSYGANNFGNLIHSVDFTVTSIPDIGTAVFVGTVWGISDYQNDMKYHTDNNYPGFFVHLACSTTVNKYRLSLQSTEDALTDSTGSIFSDDGTTYYLKIRRDADNIYCGIYSTDNLRDNGNGQDGDLDNLALTGKSTAKLEYLYASNSENYVNSRKVTGYVENLEITPLYTITFRFTSGGDLRVDNATFANGTQVEYINGTIIELCAVILNSSYIFDRFNWTSGNATTNPYNYTVAANMTVWLLYDTPAVSAIAPGFVLGAILGSVFMGLIGLSVYKHKD